MATIEDNPEKGPIPRRAGWDHLRSVAGSSSRTLRAAAISRSYAWVEHALAAAGARQRNRPIATSILGVLSDKTFGRGLDEARIRAAIRARHDSSHEDDTPTPDRCIEAVQTLNEIWRALNRRFVTFDSAVSLATRLASDPHIQAVLMYGSFARGDTPANDLDFLLLDDGEYSNQIELGSYSDGTFDASDHTIQLLDLMVDDGGLLARCAQCRWLDIIVVDGSRFARDAEYTTALSAIQPDPWFFVNIARDLLEFDADGTFERTERFPFPELRRIHEEVRTLGLDPFRHRATGSEES